MGGEPLRHHADADHEAGANDGEQQAGDHEMIEVLRGRKHQAGNGGVNEQGGIGDPGPEFIEQHPDQNPCRNRQGHVADGQGADLGNGEAEIGLDRRGQRGQIEPDHKSEEEREPGEVKGSVSSLEGPEFAKHESGYG